MLVQENLREIELLYLLFLLELSLLNRWLILLRAALREFFRYSNSTFFTLNLGDQSLFDNVVKEFLSGFAIVDLLPLSLFPSHH